MAFRGRVEHRNSQYALYATARMRGGLRSDLRSDAGWWQTPLWQYAVFAVVIYSRAAAERFTVPVEEIARRIAARTASSSPRDQSWATGSPETGEGGCDLAVWARPASSIHDR